MKIDELRTFRRALHARPELSGAERETARTVAKCLESLAPSRVWRGLGGHGVAAAFDGPTVLVRADLDALPIQETGRPEHRSKTPGVSHACGHDGHTTIAMGLAARVAAARPARGRVIVLFQPAEETGEGARAVALGPRFDELRPDWAFALHNLPGAPLGSVLLREGTFGCASRGLSVELAGSTSHAAHPEDGRSPAAAMCELIATLRELPLDASLADGGFALSTVVHARLGEVAFGTSPGEAVVMATLRAERDGTIERMADLAIERTAACAARHGLDARTEWREVFDACVNDADAVDRVRAAAQRCGAPVVELESPFRWSEDFGAIPAKVGKAMFGLGAGEAHPPLHAPDYDFPDELIAPGVEVFEGVVRDLLGSDA
ncbi:MAG: amidohydrolase [Planctomycetota bacterium]